MYPLTSHTLGALMLHVAYENGVMPLFHVPSTHIEVLETHSCVKSTCSSSNEVTAVPCGTSFHRGVIHDAHWACVTNPSACCFGSHVSSSISSLILFSKNPRSNVLANVQVDATLPLKLLYHLPCSVQSVSAPLHVSHCAACV